MLALPFPLIDPVAIAFGPLQIYWYGLAYVIGTLGAWWWARHLLTAFPNGITHQNIDDTVIWLLLSAIIGGRIGYVLFYQPSILTQHPLEIFMTWKGGMSFHGGLIGVICGSVLLCYRKKIPYLRLMDVVATCIPFVLFLGRIANFINAEMYGRITSHPWGVIFPNGGALPRHPSQLYEAAAEGVILFIVLNVCWRSTSWRYLPGRFSGLFLTGYGFFRIFIEYFKEPEAWIGSLTIGQFLSLPLVCIGWFLLRRPVTSTAPHA